MKHVIAVAAALLLADIAVAHPDASQNADAAKLERSLRPRGRQHPWSMPFTPHCAEAIPRRLFPISPRTR